MKASHTHTHTHAHTHTHTHTLQIYREKNRGPDVEHTTVVSTSIIAFNMGPKKKNQLITALLSVLIGF